MAYHHGNARTAILQSASELLEINGAARLSLRQVAEQAGLSRQAPYNHFADKETLLGELVRDGFVRLDAEIRAAGSDVPPSERLARAAHSYIAFGLGRPALFRLMFSKELVDISRHQAAQDAASAVLGQLSEIITCLAPAANGREVSLVAWSVVHGYTSLCVEIGLEGTDEIWVRAQLFARAIEALAVSPTMGCDDRPTERPSPSGA